MSIISASTTTTTAYQVTADTTGTLVLQTGASPTTAVTIDGSQNVTLTGNITLNNGTADGAQLVLQSSGFSDWNIDNYNGNFRWYYNTTEYMRLTNTGNLGLGVTPKAWASGKALELGYSGHGIWGNGANETIVMTNAYFNGAWRYAASSIYAVQYSQLDGQHRFFTAPTGTADAAITWTQAMTLDASGNLLVGTTTKGYGLFSSPRVTLGNGGAGDGFCVGGLNQNLSAYTVQADNNTGTRYFAYIANGSSASVGTISFTSTATAYNTSSDYRLKENIQPMQNALETISQLNPVTYTWKADGSDGQGFIAHELQAVVPECVTGEKDAVDADGNPVYQGIDTSFLVATLTAAIQEQQALINAQQAALTQLQADVAALKGQA